MSPININKNNKPYLKKHSNPSSRSFQTSSDKKNQNKKSSYHSPKSKHDQKTDHISPILIKTLLFQSKERKEKNDVDFLEDDENSETAHVTATETTKSINRSSPTPTLVSEKSPWKNKILNQKSLIHLLVLETIYTRHFHSFSENHDSTIDWIIENQGFFLKQDLSNQSMILKNEVTKWLELVTKESEKTINEINPFLIDWTWDRLPLIKQTILHVAWSLIKHAKLVEVPNLLNDAINHSKWFGDSKDYAFTNSILDKLITQNKLWPRTS